MLTIDQAIEVLRTSPCYTALVRDAYLGPDVGEAAERFASSDEFAEVCRHLAGRLTDGIVLDVGAGNGIASHAFTRAGARRVYALEPDPSAAVGRGAIRQLTAGLPVEALDAWAERIPLPDRSIDIVYGRQVLHHIRNLPQALAECARVLRSGGLFLACREHVVHDARELRRFLAAHPIHQLAGGENAYRLTEYLYAIRGAGLRIRAVLKPGAVVMNAFPVARSAAELRQFPRCVGNGSLARLAARFRFVPGFNGWLWRWLASRPPGRLYSFLAEKL